MEDGSFAGATTNMFSPASPRRISGTSSAADQLRFRFDFISDCWLDTAPREELRGAILVSVNQGFGPRKVAVPTEESARRK